MADSEPPNSPNVDLLVVEDLRQKRKGAERKFGAHFGLYIFTVVQRTLRGAARDVQKDCMVRALDRVVDVIQRDDVRDSIPTGSPGLRRWIGRIVSNAAIDEWRRRARRLKYEAEAASEHGVLQEPPPTPFDQTLEVLQMDALQCEIAKLDPPHREIIELSMAYESIEKVAEILGIPDGTAKSRKSRAIAQLRRALKYWENPHSSSGDAQCDSQATQTKRSLS